MTDSIPEKIVKMIIAFWLAGFPFPEIIAQIETKEHIRVAKSTISNKVSSFLAGLNSSEIWAVKELAVYNRSLRIPVEHLAMLLRLRNRLDRAGKLSSEDLENLFLGLAMLSKQPLDRVAAAIADMVKITEMEGIPFAEAATKARQISEERKDSELKLTDAKKELSQLQQDIERTLVETGLTKADITEIRIVRQELGKLGLQDVRRAIKLVQSLASRFHWDEGKVSAIVNSLDQLDHRRTKLIQEISRHEARQAEMRDKDKLYDRVSRSEMTNELWDNLDHKINMIAISQGKNKATAMRDAILHFILYYNEFQGLLPVLIQTQKTVESLKFNEKWLRHKNFVLQNENAALEKVNGDLAKLIDQRVIRLDDLENEEKRRQENIDRLTTEEGNCLKRLEQIKNKITSRLEALASLDREISKKDIGVSSVTSATPIYLEMPVKESGVTYFQSDKTTLNSGVTMSGFAS